MKKSISLEIISVMMPWVKNNQSEPETYEFSDISDADALDEFHRQAELYLESLVKVAIAADARATTLTGILGAATAALSVLCANLASAKEVNTALLVAVACSALTLLVAASYCAAAARPVDFFITGYEPKRLYQSAVSKKHIKQVSAEDIQVRIDRNAQALESASQALKRGRWIAASAALVFIIVFCLLSR